MDTHMCDVILQNTTPYTRCLLTPVSRWFAEHCVAVSMQKNAALVYIPASPIVNAMNLLFGFMLHSVVTHRPTDVSSAYNDGVTNDNWHRDYHLLMRRRPQHVTYVTGLAP